MTIDSGPDPDPGPHRGGELVGAALDREAGLVEHVGHALRGADLLEAELGLVVDGAAEPDQRGLEVLGRPARRAWPPPVGPRVGVVTVASLDHGDDVAGPDRVARGHLDLFHRARLLGGDGVLHLHGLEQAHRLAHLDGVARRPPGP